MTELTAINDLLSKTKALEAKYRKRLDSPRAWAENVISGNANMLNVPDEFRLIVEDHIATHEMHVQTASDRILALQNGKMRLDAFNALPEALRPFVRDRVHDINRKKHNDGNKRAALAAPLD